MFSRSLLHLATGTALLLLFAGTAAGLPSARAASLAEALTEAYETNPTLLASRAGLGGTDEHVPEALSGWRPHVEMHVENGLALRQNSIDLKYEPEHLTPQDDDLTVTQNLYTSGRVRAEVKQAGAQVAVARAMLVATTNDVLLAAGTAYADVARDRAIVGLDRYEDGVLAHLYRSEQVELAAGEVTDADVEQVHARVADQAAVTAAAEAVLAASEARYEQEIGVAPGDVALPGPPLHLPATEADAIGRALDRNPALVTAENTLRVTRLGVDISIDRLLPNIALVGLFEHLREYEYESHAQSANEAQATVVLTMPLYQGGLLYARIREAKEDNLRSQDLVDQQRRLAQQLTITGWAALVAAEARVHDEAISAAANHVTVLGYTSEQQVGARTTIDVLVADQAELASDVALVAARRDQLVDGLDLLAVTGPIEPATLQLAAPAYDPLAHFRAVHEKWAGTAPPNGDQVRPHGPIRLRLLP